MTTFFGETIGFFATKTTMHGVKTMVDADSRAMRTVWTLIVITNVIIAVFNGTKVTNSYMIEGLNTTKIVYNVHAETGLPLPMVTICPSRNPFLASRLDERRLSSNGAAYLMLMADKTGNAGLLGKTLQKQQQAQAQLSDELQRSLRDNETLVDLFNYLSPTCDEMIAGCYVYGQYMNGSTCCSEVFSENYAIYHQGRCISSRFSTLLLRENQTRPGDFSGISIILQEDKETFSAELDIRMSMVPIQEGNRVILNPWYLLPHEALTEQTYIADVGAVTRLGLSSTTIDRLGLFTDPWPWSVQRCASLPQPWVEGRVESDTCRVRRLCAVYQARFNCTPLGMMDTITAEEANNTTICQPHDILRASPASTAALNDGPSCPAKCNEVTLVATIDSTPFKQQVLEHSLVFGAAAAASPDRNLTFSVIMVFYPNLMSREIVLSQATFMEWLSAFGGQLSLFLGASVITMLEILVFSGRVVAIFGWKVVGALSPAPSEESARQGSAEAQIQGEGKRKSSGEMKRKRLSGVARVEPVAVPAWTLSLD